MGGGFMLNAKCLPKSPSLSLTWGQHHCLQVQTWSPLLFLVPRG